MCWKAVRIQSDGIKCDYCDWNDPHVHFRNYAFWHNRPCPKCGYNLLTDADYKAVKRLVFMVSIINIILFPVMLIINYLKLVGLISEDREDETIVAKAEMDGSGHFKIRKK